MQIPYDGATSGRVRRMKALRNDANGKGIYAVVPTVEKGGSRSVDLQLVDPGRTAAHVR